MQADASLAMIAIERKRRETRGLRNLFLFLNSEAKSLWIKRGRTGQCRSSCENFLDALTPKWS
jgi:hypothetical protein